MDRLSSQTIPTYTYTSFVHSESIRILCLEPGQPTEPIQASLIEQRFTHELNYEAISYTWGDPIFPKTIFIDGFTFKVTDNLYAALVHLRRNDEKRSLWVDALCINQQSNEEKGVQVAMMGQIFAQAIRVLVWLGEGTEETATAMNNLHQLQEQAGGHDFRTRFSWDTGEDDQMYTPLLEPLRAVIKVADDIFFPWLLKMPWFSRLWVVQEIVLAKDVLVMCGPSTVRWKVLADCISIYRNACMDIGHDQDGIKDYEPAHLILQTKELYQHLITENFEPTKHKAFLRYLPMKLESQACADTRDRVYAILGILRFDRLSGPEHMLKPDYALSPAQVFKQFTRELLSHGVDMLDEVGLHRCPRLDMPNSLDALGDRNYLPSWSAYFYELDDTYDSFMGYSFVPWITKPSGTPVQVSFDVSGGTMITKAQSLGSIAEVIGDPHCRYWTLEFVSYYITELRDKFLPTFNSTIAETKLSILARTLVADGAVRGFEKHFGKNPTPEQILDLWKHFERECQPGGKVFGEYIWLEEADMLDTERTRELLASIGQEARPAFLFYDCVRHLLRLSVLFVTTEGHLGVAPRGNWEVLIEGARIFAVPGARTPLIFKAWAPGSETGNEHYLLVGPAYVHGLVREDERPLETRGDFQSIRII